MPEALIHVSRDNEELQHPPRQEEEDPRDSDHDGAFASDPDSGKCYSV